MKFSSNPIAHKLEVMKLIFQAEKEVPLTEDAKSMLQYELSYHLYNYFIGDSTDKRSYASYVLRELCRTNEALNFWMGIIEKAQNKIGTKDEKFCCSINPPVNRIFIPITGSFSNLLKM